MESIANELEVAIQKYLPILKSFQDSQLTNKLSPEKWSRKEIIGHMIDSAQTNIRRFVVAQYEVNPTIVYDQDEWVAICNYQNWNSVHLIDLWHLLNLQICDILKNLSPEKAQRQCQTEELHTIEWLAQDYSKHLKHHLHQVTGLEPIPY
jgi:hypothetical protein